jgi:hypothetical protein
MSALLLLVGGTPKKSEALRVNGPVHAEGRVSHMTLE